MNTDDADRNPTTTPSAGGQDNPVLTPVERAVGAYLDFLEGLGPRPLLDGLADDDRADVVAVINTVLAGQGNDLASSAPPFEQLLVGTEFESTLRAAQAATVSVRHDAGAATTTGERSGVDRQRARMERIATALQGIDERVVIGIQPDDVVGSAVAVSYLDLRAIFFSVDAEEPIIAGDVRADVEVLFADADLAYVGVVADGSTELLTQLLSPSDLQEEAVVVAPSDELTIPWLPVLTAPQALRWMLETAAPTWEPYRLDIDLHEPLDLAAVAARISRTVLEAETSRAYRGDKKAAYQALSGSIDTFARLVAELSRGPVVDDERATAAVESIVREAA
ncbi:MULTISPECIES: hypothetical protein [Mycobacterium avium complex (MAC)]|uniref:hypothetical protein n=1 Tax=Mycobacterium avium complex (MAC) TaxID=120793 RepID=UPI000A03948E|nr:MULTISPECIES: hypothetical protein [Mycobacterium avium complex (MAC)]QWY63651.1 hypothetical protein BJP74_25625 [Mycobacterium avium subsp. hominissuis]